VTNFTENERRVLEFLKDKETSTNAGIAKELSLDEKMVNEILHVLRQSGWILFKQDFHLSRGELMVVKISNRGVLALEEKKVNGAVPAKASGYDFVRIASAVQFAMEAHKEEFRKGTTIPYIVHPLDVLSILLKNGAGEDLAIAGVLHDVTEDTDYTLQDIQTKFGDAVALLVEGASEPEELTKGVSNEEKRKTWKLRKSQKIEKMKHASRELRLLTCADKLANIRDIISNYQSQGDALWSKFNASKEEESWYYHQIAEAMAQPDQKDSSSSLKDSLAFKELETSIRELFGA
jgi:(p)ppGpp synthase/HD superfamily hydrolase